MLLLPSRPPKPNPVEDLWQMLTNRAATNPEQSLDALKTAYKRFFEQLSPEEALQEASFTAR